MVADAGGAAPGDSGGRFLALDSLRGLAACLVVLEHMPGDGWLGTSPLLANGWLAVDFFFVLSGFVIASAYGDRLHAGFSLARYSVLRIGRIWPLHLCVLAVAVAIEAVGLVFDMGRYIHRDPFTGGHDPLNLAASALLLHIWQSPGENLWNVQSWTISAELFLYLGFALAWRWLGRATLLVASVAVAGSTVLLFSDLNDIDWVARALFGFSLGVLVEGLRRRLPTLRRGTGANAIEALAALAGLAALAYYDWLSQAVCGLAFAAVVLAFSYDAGALSRLLSRPAAVFLGTISYSIYMVHPLIVGRIRDALQFAGERAGQTWVTFEDGRELVVGGPLADIFTLSALLVTIGVAAFAYRWIEKPARAASRRIAARLGARREGLGTGGDGR